MTRVDGQWGDVSDEELVIIYDGLTRADRLRQLDDDRKRSERDRAERDATHAAAEAVGHFMRSGRRERSTPRRSSSPRHSWRPTGRVSGPGPAPGPQTAAESAPAVGQSRTMIDPAVAASVNRAAICPDCGYGGGRHAHVCRLRANPA